MYDNLVKSLRTTVMLYEAVGQEDLVTTQLMKQAADAIEERDRYALTLQHEMMAEAESHIALVERLNRKIEELSKRVPPVPHGRLIDADAFFDDLLFPSKQFEQGMRELIGDAPTVIPAEETLKEATND